MCVFLPYMSFYHSQITTDSCQIDIITNCLKIINMDKKELAARRIKSLRAKGKNPQRAKTTTASEHFDKLEETTCLPNNWSRYKELESDEEDLAETSDFHILSQAPLPAESHFKFKSEQSWNLETPEFNKYFTLDLDRLSKGIACIPFHNTLNISESVFTKSQLESINGDALKNKELYLKSYSLHNGRKMLIQDLDEESITDEGLIDNIHKIKNNDIDRPNEKLLDDVSIRNENKGKNKVEIQENQEIHIPVNQTKKELESWLDNLLDSDE